jgi:anaerobic selenocysteine-containing dehydrogenase
MDRRNFFKIVSTVSAGAATIACESKKSDALIPLLVPDHEIVPGDEQWHPSICPSCDAGCGTIVRVMRAERIIEKNGEKFREPIASIKKIEGNPLDSVSAGRLCARGHAALQSLYNPDRLTQPMKRTGARGEGKFTPISWDEAIAAVSEKVHAANPSKITFLTSPQQGTRLLNINQFLKALGAPPAATCSLADFAMERKAADIAFGWQGIPRYDLASARYVLGVGADFLGGWVSPVYYARQYGHFRQGRPGLRGKLVQAESRMSLTAASADEWLPVRPGAEPHLIAAITQIIQNKNENLADLIKATGLPEKRLHRIAQELHDSEAPLVIAGASIVQSNSLDALIAAHQLNALLGNIGKLVQPPTPSSALPAANLTNTQVLFLDGANPVYTHALSIAKIETIISFGNFIDDSTAFADLILPDHHPLESEYAVIPPVAATQIAFTVTEPFVRPLYNTQALPQTLAAIAKTQPITPQQLIEPLLKEGETWTAVSEQGGLWRDDKPETPVLKPISKPISGTVTTTPKFAGDPAQYPLHFQPYLSLQYHDGRAANLPWMQELPDPTSSSMWGLPIEIDPHTAASLNLNTGDWVRVESPHASLDAQAYIHPAALPGVLSMAIGDGHTTYGRYASNRGANPMSLRANTEPTRVRITKLTGKPANLIQFSPNDREQGPWGYR